MGLHKREGKMKIVFQSGTIIPGTGDVIENGTVVVEDGVFGFVGPSNEFRIPDKATPYDLSGKTLMPGLIDCHVHICLDGGPDPVTSLFKDSIPIITLKTALHARSTIEAGVTTIRDLGGVQYVDLAIRDSIESKLIPGPRMICCGKLVCMTGGHGWQFGQEANGLSRVREAVREQLKVGANVIKLMATGGVITKGVDPGVPQLTVEELTAGVEEARKAGRRTASHCQGNEGIKNALEAGIDSIEHGVGLDEQAIELMLKKGAYLVPTLNAPYQILKNGTRRGIPSFVVEKTKFLAKNHQQGVKRAYKAGVPIAMGTDAGIPYNRHGENGKELELLVKLGLSPLEAITASTKTASEVLGLEKRIGTIEKGKVADLLVIKGNPLQDISLLQDREKIRAIMKEGLFHKCGL
jgi:imidazolonepropionase-like amidohydrolase